MAGGLIFPVCARDTGIYLGLALSLAVLHLMYYRDTAAGFPAIPVLVIVVVLFVPLAIDGATSYLGWRETTNAIRYLTGIGTGIGIGMLLAWALRSLLPGGDESRRFLAGSSRVALWLGATWVPALIFWFVYPYLSVVGAILTAACILFVFCIFNIVILLYFNLVKRPFAALPRTFLLVGGALAASIVELAILSAAKAGVALLFNMV